MEKNKITKRSSSIEILRIISMLLIILHHFSYHGISNLCENLSIGGKCISDVFSLGGKLGVDIFVLISAYFCVDKNITIKKLLKLERRSFILFYNYIINISTYKNN